VGHQPQPTICIVRSQVLNHTNNSIQPSYYCRYVCTSRSISKPRLHGSSAAGHVEVIYTTHQFIHCRILNPRKQKRSTILGAITSPRKIVPAVGSVVLVVATVACLSSVSHRNEWRSPKSSRCRVAVACDAPAYRWPPPRSASRARGRAIRALMAGRRSRDPGKKIFPAEERGQRLGSNEPWTTE
jgi:hypothetical protein